MKKFTRFMLLAVAVLTCSVAMAQDEEFSERELEARVLKLEEKFSWMPKISGSVWARYQFDTYAGDKGFDIRRARLDIKGNIAPKLDYRLQLEFASSPKIIDAFVRYTPVKGFGVQFGQAKFPFTLENPISPLKLETIENAMGVSYMSGFSDLSGIKANGRDIGLSIFGDLFKGVINYQLGVYNGAGINKSDDNKHKDFAGRLNVNPIKHLTLSGSVYLGKTGAQAEMADRNRYAVGARFDNKALVLRSEYIWGSTGEQQSEGVYALAGYWVTKKIMPVVRYDYFCKNAGATDLAVKKASAQTNYLVGVDYWPLKNLRLQFNYTYQHFTGTGNDSGKLALQVCGVF
ncbi:MAG: porin [Rikenellaceae bacterium]|nr:porin [Rikenellaceae bacterium]